MTSTEANLPPLAAFIAKEIRHGRYPIGSLLPPEQDLEKTYALSRYAVREATARLQELGLIQKRRGIGTTVIAREPTKEHIYRLSTPKDFADYAKVTCFLIRLNEIRDEPDPIFRISRSDYRWRKLQGLRHLLQTHDMLSLDTAYVREDYSALPEIGKSLSVGVSRLVEARFGIKFERIEQEIAADIADANDARSLGIEIGAPLLVVTRQYLFEGEPIILAMGRHPADKFRYKTAMNLEPVNGETFAD